MADVQLYVGETLARYGFPKGHPLGVDRLGAFWSAAQMQNLHRKARIIDPVVAAPEAIARFHALDYIRRVQKQSVSGSGLLDRGDTPAFEGCFEAASYVVGSTLDALAAIMDGRCQRAFVPIAGLHHARRESAGGFCIFNDCGVVIKTLQSSYGLKRVAYIDIDAHHGDGVYYAFESDPGVVIADIHESGRFLYPGTGSSNEIGIGPAQHTKLNIEMNPGATDQEFLTRWPQVLELLEKFPPEFILLQCGADAVGGDPLTHLNYSPQAYSHAARSLVEVAERRCGGRLLAVGGGGYNLANIGAAWTAVVHEILA